jgi:peptidoglycan/xylan/chitin deacetylase (PgdA/CDA1 family)
MLLAVTYHYVAEAPPRAPRSIFPVTPAQLAAQLDAIGRSFEFVARDDLVRAVRHEQSLPQRACLVTFDDGLRCQFELSLSVLELLGIPALFFVPAAPVVERRVLDVHKVHRLRETMRDEKILEALGAQAPEAPEGRHVYDEPLAAGVKELLAHVETDQLDELLSSAGAEVDIDLYMTAEQVTELERHGMLGAHGYSHDVRDDLCRGADALEQLVGARPLTMSYPYGRPLPGADGFVAAFTTERRLNRDLDHPLLLGRLDTNDVPGGRAPRLVLDDGEPHLIELAQL